MDPKEARVLLYSGEHKVTDYILANLHEFPQETLMVWLKYGLEQIRNGDVFFLQSLDKPIGPWLDFTLSLCKNINHVNISTGETILHTAVRWNNLPLVMKILSHRADVDVINTKGKRPIDLTTEDDVKFQLERYSKDGNGYAKFYFTYGSGYFELDEIEEVAIRLVTWPSYLDEANASDEIRRAVSIYNKLQGWPMYIDATIIPRMGSQLPEQVEAAAPPDFRTVNIMALKELKDTNEVKSVVPVAPVKLNKPTSLPPSTVFENPEGKRFITLPLRIPS